MSADNYNYVDYHPENEVGRRWSVTNGFDSDNRPPAVPNGSTRWFGNFDGAAIFAETDWTEYGARYSSRAWENHRNETED